MAYSQRILIVGESDNPVLVTNGALNVTTGSSVGLTTFTSSDAAALSITTGGTSQQVFAANSARKYLLLQNISVEDLWVNFGAAATQDTPSLKLLPNGVGILEFPQGGAIETGTIHIIGATTGSKYVAKQG